MASLWPFINPSPHDRHALLQLAEIYLHAKGGMQRGTYIPAAMYSCGPHKAGPQLEKTTTHIAAVA